MARRIDPYKKFFGVFIPNWLAERPEVSPGAKIVYGRMVQFYGKNKECFPKLSTLGEETGMSERQARRYVRELLKHKLIEVEYRKKACQSSMYYFLDHPWTDGADLEEAKPRRGGERRNLRSEVDGAPGQKCPDPPVSSDRSPRSKVADVIESKNMIKEATQGMAPAQSACDPGDPAGRETPGESPEKACVEASSAETPVTNPVSGHTSPGSSGVVIDLDAHVARLRSQNAAHARQSNEDALSKQRDKEQRLRNLEGSQAPLGERQALHDLEVAWRAVMAALYPEMPAQAQWMASQRGQVKKLMESYNHPAVRLVFDYVRHEWEHLKRRYLRGAGTLSLSFVLRFHESLFIEANQWHGFHEVEQQYQEWKRQNPGAFRAPPELSEAHAKAMAGLEALRGTQPQPARSHGR